MKTICRMMEHLFWANEKLLAALSEQRHAHVEIWKLVRHIAIAEQVWIHRLQGSDSSHLVLWEEAEISTLSELIHANEQQYRQYIDRLAETDLDVLISYSNQSGVMFQSSIRDILIHVAQHGQYHRGQMNRAFREQSANPVNVDFITFTRNEGLSII